MNVCNFGNFTIPIFPIGKNPREVRKSGISVQNHTTTEAIFCDKKGALRAQNTLILVLDDCRILF